MASLATLRESLREQASVKPDEGCSSELLDTFLNQALTAHNSNYSFSILPVREEEAVLVLAWIRLCYWRASRVANENNAGGSQFASERETPYTKNMRLATGLQSRYNSICDSLGISASSTSPTSSTMVARDNDTEAQFPLHSAKVPLVAQLSVAEVASVPTSAVVSWQVVDPDNQVCDYVLFHSTSAVVDPTNFESDSGYPGVVNGATRLIQLSASNRVTSVKVDDLTRNGVNNYFVLGIRTFADVRVLTNEAVLSATSATATVEISDLGNVFCYGGKLKVAFTNGGTSFTVILQPNQWLILPPNSNAGEVRSSVETTGYSGGEAALRAKGSLLAPQTVTSGASSWVLTPL